MAEFFDIYEPLRATKTYRDIFNPLENYCDQQLYDRYRCCRREIEFLCDLLRDELEHDNGRGRAVPLEVQIMVGIRYLASNSLQRDIGDSFRIDQGTVSRIVSKFLNALSTKLPMFVKFPTTEETRRENQREFARIAGFPQVVGCIDCTHVRVMRAQEDEADYVNRKGFHSLNVQAVCDYKARFTNLVVKWPGRTHDSFILRNSDLWHAFETQALQGKLLGDSGYPLKPWLMTPYQNPSGETQKRYNSAHRRTRVLVEQAFGRLKRRFLILHGENRLPIAKVPKVVACCFILHNIAIDAGYEYPQLEDVELDEEVGAEDYNGNMNNGAVYRDHFAEVNFG